MSRRARSMASAVAAWRRLAPQGPWPCGAARASAASANRLRQVPKRPWPWPCALGMAHWRPDPDADCFQANE
eukprot:6185956-Pleurochrysis_carterae.AAC.2